jgi:hypothetical protein
MSNIELQYTEQHELLVMHNYFIQQALRVTTWPASHLHVNFITLTLWSESASELYRPSDRRLSAKLVPTFAGRGWHLVRVTDPYGRILGFLDRSRYFSIK